jgi:hypothetical protein
MFDTEDTETAVMMVMAGERPERPYCLDNYIMPAEFFELITDCWNHTPEERPTMKEALGYFAVGPEEVYVDQPLFVAQVEMASPAAAGKRLLNYHTNVRTYFTSMTPSSHRDGQVDPSS